MHACNKENNSISYFLHPHKDEINLFPMIIRTHSFERRIYQNECMHILMHTNRSALRACTKKWTKHRRRVCNMFRRCRERRRELCDVFLVCFDMKRASSDLFLVATESPRPVCILLFLPWCKKRSKRKSRRQGRRPSWLGTGGLLFA